MPSSWGVGVLLPRVPDVNEDSVQLRQTPEFTNKDKRLNALADSLLDDGRTF